MGQNASKDVPACLLSQGYHRYISECIPSIQLRYTFDTSSINISKNIPNKYVGILNYITRRLHSNINQLTLKAIRYFELL